MLKLLFEIRDWSIYREGDEDILVLYKGILTRRFESGTGILDAARYVALQIAPAAWVAMIENTCKTRDAEPDGE